MSKLQKKNKQLNINFHSSGKFLGLNKPKLLKIGKSYDIKNIKIKKTNHNISQDTFPMENITRQTESSSKDEIIRALKERLTILEKKVKILEKENNDNTTKINTLNISHGHQKKMSLLPTGPGLKLNMKLVKNKKSFLNFLDMSKTYMRKSNYSSNSIISLNNSNYNSNIEEKKNNNKSRNFFNSINTSEYNFNSIGIRVNNSANKYKNKHCTIIPRNNSKQKFFMDILKRSMTKCSTLEYSKFKNINDINKNIPKIPRKRKQFKSEVLNIGINKLINNSNNSINKNLNLENKNEDLMINNNYRNESSDLNNFNNLFNSKTSFNNIKNKLENIKTRTKSLLEFYSLNKSNNSINNSYLLINKNKRNSNIIISNDNDDISNNINKESISPPYDYNI
jgi:hypothetical protein